MRILQPLDWPRPKGYSNGIAATGTLVFIAGQVGWNARQEFDSDDLVAQAGQALRNIVAVLATAGGRPEHVARLTWYVTSKAEYMAGRKALGAAYRAVMGDHYPVMTAVEVTALMARRAKVEIEATAVIGSR